MTIAGDTYIANMLKLAGCRVWAPENNTLRYPAFSWNDTMATQFDSVLLSTEPYRFTEAHVDALERHSASLCNWSMVKCCRGMAAGRSKA
jgi:hypothetical protein